MSRHIDLGMLSNSSSLAQVGSLTAFSRAQGLRLFSVSYPFPSLTLSSLGLPSLAATPGHAAAPFVTSSPNPLPATSIHQGEKSQLCSNGVCFNYCAFHCCVLNPFTGGRGRCKVMLIEELLISKTRESLLDSLTEHVKANHEYDVPEVIALPIQGGNLKYLKWLKNSTREN
ncbi:protein CutA 1, chloroplastic [Panicum miliaceum]|uniref:Protein CutA 1, chloroplastic n=1 Tax=Panicum miliaceum TaxID=4540 RepID=A0A3L6S6T8_PANMI|nr:protein CutA 1, chloroplastic [Panicum miliaceum]